MGFGSELWDNFGACVDRTEEGLQALKIAEEFFRKLADLEAKFAQDMRKLCKKTHKNSFGKKMKEVGSNRDAWETTLREVEAIAAHHTANANDLNQTVAEPLKLFIREKERLRGDLLKEGQRLMKELETGYSTLAKVKNNYNKAAKTAENNQTLYDRADADPNFSVIQVEKVQAKAQSAIAKCQSSDEEYQGTVRITNELQHNFFTNTFPKVLDDLQRLEEERIMQFQASMQQMVTLHQTMAPNLAANYETIQHACMSIDKDADIAVFIGENVSGKSPPGEIQYEPADFVLSLGGGNPSFGAPSRGSGPSFGGPSRGGGPSSGGAMGGVGGGGGDLSSLGPAELQRRLEECKREIMVQQKTRSGIETLVPCYPEGSEAHVSVMGQIADCDAIINAKAAEQREIEGMLGIESTAPSGFGGAAAGGYDQQQGGAVASVAGGVAPGYDEYGGYYDEYGGYYDADGTYYEAGSFDPAAYGAPAATGGYDQGGVAAVPVAPVSGGGGDYATAAYPYEARGPGELSFNAGDSIEILARDDSGWWTGRFNGQEGLVPSNYMG